MEAIIERCCGIDVHKKSITVCLMIGDAGKPPSKTIKTFSTMTRDLLACRDWLLSKGFTHAVVESTGVHWKPIFNVLEDTMVVSDINGVSAQEMVQHLIADDMNPEQMAELARGRLRNKLPELEKAL